MTNSIPQEVFVQQFLAIWQETFDTHHGIYLDKGTSLIATLDGISAAQASIPVGGRCATLAAQVEHVIFYLDVLERYMLGQEVGQMDWGDIWRRVGAVSPAEWDDLRSRLQATYQRLSARLQGFEDWEQANALGGAMALVVHTAYHLGEIRQATCTLAQADPAT